MQWREPIEFSAGDTLQFTRTLHQYPASQGWSLLYELRGGTQALSFTSTASGDSHSIYVAPATTATWTPGDYVLTGYATNGTDRHQIYYGDLPLHENKVTAPGNAPELTFAQKMIAQIEATLLAKADDLSSASLGETRFTFLTPEELRKEHGYWTTVRRQEIAKERAKMGLPTGNRIKPSIQVVDAGIGGVHPFNWR